MFKMIVDRPESSEKWNEMCNYIKEMGEIHGFISIQTLINIFHPHITNIENPHKKGWNYKALYASGYPIFRDSAGYLGRVLMCFPDPIDLNFEELGEDQNEQD